MSLCLVDQQIGELELAQLLGRVPEQLTRVLVNNEYAGRLGINGKDSLIRIHLRFSEPRHRITGRRVGVGRRSRITRAAVIVGGGATGRRH